MLRCAQRDTEPFSAACCLEEVRHLVTPTGTLFCLVAAGAGLYLLAPVPLQGAPQQGSAASPVLRSVGSRSTRPTWHGRPASTPPELEAVPLPPAVPPPSRSLILGPRKE